MLERKSKYNPKTSDEDKSGGKSGDLRDLNEVTLSINQRTTGETPNQEPPPPAPTKVKNEAAVTLGRLGGLKGGDARAKSLTSEQKKAIAEKAARARWHSRKDD
jgi:hypothetical protein